jgi:hypothetical protein
MVTCKVCFDGWAGRFQVKAEVLAECKRAGRPHYKVRFLEPVGRRFAAGQIGYPPEHAVTDVKEEATR